jgi:hypothetical protein
MSHQASNSKRSETALPKAKPLDPAAPPEGKPDQPRAANKPLTPDVQAAPAEPAPSLTWRERLSLRGMTSFLVSSIFHATLILLLSLLAGFIPAPEQTTLVVTSHPGDGVSPEDLDSTRFTLAEAGGADSADANWRFETSSEIDIRTDDVLRGSSQQLEPARKLFDPSSAAMVLRSLNLRGGGLQGRRGDQKGELIGKRGGTPESENAVALALAWLAAHQWQDGGWRLDLTDGPCGGQCRNSGTIGTTTGATGLALLPFLGAGHTHLQGEYRDVVDRGLYYLRNHIVMTPHGADLQEGTMYAQGIAAIALCEAYAMTQDESLRLPAQRAINFICHAQHSGGGWRYYPGQPGDTTVFGWQMMALKSAAMAGLDVPSPVITLAERFLDSVQSAKGSYYGYLIRGKKPGPTAIGLLVRMYTGWPQDDPRLKRGVDFLVNEGPSKRDMYFNYYATQVMNHFDGPAWPKWNEQLREYLIETQAATGHERGSWYFLDQHGVKGGRLYTTAMCAMILEVYYRHMPLYETMAVEEDL